MVILIGFALLAGAGTAVTPCVLPVLPALLSAGAAGGRRRPVGIVLGLTATFTVTIVGLASVVNGVGKGGGTVRTLAIVVLAGFGLALLVPSLAARVEAPLSRLARFGPRTAGTGFWSGLGVGAALGFVYAPCAGPILAAVISVSATRGTSASLVAIALAYAAGSAAVLLLMALGGRRIAERIRRAGRGPALQRALGVVLIATAALMLTSLDVRFQTALATHFPSFLTNPTKPIEQSAAVSGRLDRLRGRSRFAATAPGTRVTRAHGMGARLPVLGRAPDFTGTQRWFNTPSGRPLTLAALRGRVVLVDFWTYTCINCIRTLPYLKAWDAKYRRAGLTIVGVHSPEFSFEQDAGNVARAIRQNGLRYPVAQDNRLATWTAWGNQYWPAEYLIDAQGRVRHVHFGEGDYGASEVAIRSLLAEAGDRRLGGRTHPRAVAPSAGALTPETYLGAARAERFVPRPPRPGTFRFPGFGGPLPPDHLAYRGVWTISPEGARAGRGAALDLSFNARRVYLVLGSRGAVPRRVAVRLDGRPAGAVTVRDQQLYTLVSLPRVERRRLTLRFPRSVSAYAFTFG